MSEMTPREIVSELDKHIIGQDNAKRSVAIALRNRWRRMQLNEELRHEVTPKNILMIGPTGVGKTEIARRLAKLANAPFIKVEATKFTEVGYVGKEVDSIIRDLTDAAVKMVRVQAIEKNRYRAEELAEERILDVLIPPASTKHGMVKTDHILFIASGAFQIAKPSDLIPELQGRLPIRVELQALTTSDFERILTEPNASITVQYKALMATEGVNIEFTDSGIKRIAEAAWQVNESTENIGARRLHTVLERLMEEISYDASDLSGQNITIDADYVSKHLDALVADEDLSRFIL